MKRILINEDKFQYIKDKLNENTSNYKLPKFIYNSIKTHNTSLGDNPAFPPEEEAPFDYLVIKKRFKDVNDKLSSFQEIQSNDIDYLTSLLSKLIVKCYNIEKPIQENLITVCENTVNKIFKIPSDTIELNCKLVKKITPTHTLPRLTPESSDERTFQFQDIDEYNISVKTILKRRLINSLIQGAAWKYSNASSLYLEEISQLNDELPHLYELIQAINDYLLFVKPTKMNDKKLEQGSYVEVILGRQGEKTEIKSQGLIFPFLLNETIRGFFELFASHGLPQDNEKVNYLLRQADYLLAEPWDLRFGVNLWEILSKDIVNLQIIPYFFKNLCEKSVDEFNISLKEIFAKTVKGNYIIKGWIFDATKEHEYNQFVDTIKLKNANYSVLSDDTINAEELNTDLIQEYYTPDKIDDENIVLNYYDDNAIPFIKMNNGKVIYGEPSQTHQDMTYQIISDMTGIPIKDIREYQYGEYHYDEDEDVYYINGNAYDSYDIEDLSTFFDEYVNEGGNLSIDLERLGDECQYFGRYWENADGDYYSYISIWLNNRYNEGLADILANYDDDYGNINDYNMSESHIDDEVIKDLDSIVKDLGGEIDETYLVLGNEKLLLSDLIDKRNKVNISNQDKEDMQQALALHMQNAQDKWENTNDFRKTRDKVNSEKLAYRDNEGNRRTDKVPMTMAQYHDMIYQENKQKRKNI